MSDAGASRLWRAAWRYGLVGLINTGIGYAIILGLDLGLGVDPFIANAAGYVLGVVLAYWLNRRFTFGDGRGVRKTGPAYVVAVAAAFAVNQGVLALALRWLPAGPAAAAAAQAAAVISYSVALFLLSYFWVFRQRQN